ncbi:hypothetical protein B0H14DRAFT_3782301 [Mycena olivaceomarginata]|nr:hypothetical protein B0H14DRAFT_3782301 [Mycena olivaceomarginata]
MAGKALGCAGESSSSPSSLGGHERGRWVEPATAGKKGGEGEGQQGNSRDGEKEGQEKEDKEEDKEEGEREEGEGDHAPTHVELLQRKYRLAKAYFDELSKDEQEEVVKIREDDYQDRRAAHDRMVQGQKASSTEELAKCHQHAESISQRTLDELCVQMQCKGMLVLGEVVEGDEEVFLSLVQHGAMPQHPDINFSKWTPVRSKGILQAVVDFLVAYKKEEKGLSTDLRDPTPHGTLAPTDTPALCSQCMGSLLPLPPNVLDGTRVGDRVQEPVLPADSRTKNTSVTGGATGSKRGERKEEGKEGKEAKKRTGAEESSEEEEDIGWDGSDAERDDDPLADEEEEVDQLHSSTDDEHRELPFRAKPSLRYQQIVAVGQAGAHVPQKRRSRASTVSSAMDESTDGENNGALLPACPQPKPAYRRTTGDPQPAMGQLIWSE